MGILKKILFLTLFFSHLAIADDGKIALQNILKNLATQNLTNKEENYNNISKQTVGEILNISPTIKNKELQKYINQIGLSIVKANNLKQQNWIFAVIDSDDINAFSTPNGFVLITKGLINILDNEAQLASVISHEIAHVIKKHHIKIMKQTTLINDIVNIKTGKTKSLSKGAEIFSRAMDKNAEFEADSISFVLNYRTGYNPFSIINVLENIDIHSKSNSGPFALLFKTHPNPKDRIENLNVLIEENSDVYDLGGEEYKERFSYHKRVMNAI